MRNEAKHIVRWRNGSTVRFGYCRNENDVYQYQGAEFLFIGIDELTHFTLKQWQFLTSRNRCAIPGSSPCMAGATNPGNIGHAWVKALWVDKSPPPGYEQPELYDPDDYDFIHARLDDNPAKFVGGMPLGEQIARQLTAQDPTSQAIHFQRLEAEAHKQFGAHRLPKRRWNW